MLGVFFFVDTVAVVTTVIAVVAHAVLIFIDLTVLALFLVLSLLSVECRTEIGIDTIIPINKKTVVRM